MSWWHQYGRKFSFLFKSTQIQHIPWDIIIICTFIIVLTNIISHCRKPNVQACGKYPGISPSINELRKTCLFDINFILQKISLLQSICDNYFEDFILPLFSVSDLICHSCHQNLMAWWLLELCDKLLKMHYDFYECTSD